MDKEPKKTPLKLMTLTVVVVLIAIGGVAINHVLVRNDIHKLGRLSSEMETEIASLRHDLQHANMKWQAATDREELRKRLTLERTHLSPLNEDSVIEIHPQETAEP